MKDETWFLKFTFKGNYLDYEEHFLAPIAWNDLKSMLPYTYQESEMTKQIAKTYARILFTELNIFRK